jgi:hypothetical protein
VLIECAITWHLVNFKHAGFWVNTFVDKFRFAGEVDATVKAVLEFVRRCKSVGADEEILSPRGGNFLGGFYTLAPLLLANATQVIPPAPTASHAWDKIIITDASAVGWGALCFVPEGGKMAMRAAKWPHPPNHSAIAEPRGLRLACRRFLSAERALGHRTQTHRGGGRGQREPPRQGVRAEPLVPRPLGVPGALNPTMLCLCPLAL